MVHLETLPDLVQALKAQSLEAVVVWEVVVAEVVPPRPPWAAVLELVSRCHPVEELELEGTSRVIEPQNSHLC